ncbi:hypothetical protein SAMN05216559_1643 [Halomicrobium zhouii]|uniref:DUF2892 domain-containing protein n=1 Tax=Halomicrobium zhouii TaxID=767519 RepID=A0A1I6L047_9EURY|nr:hypothetical protein [Halomicrobium zhouii]SFR96560.1 hypothetical protein SAMN05216559_1643 [Halomicrobium zhouii]
MELEEDATGRDRLARMLAAAGLTVAAAALFRRGKRITGALAGIGALALGYQATTDTLETEPTASPSRPATSSALVCAICGEPIVPGQARGPDENDDIVHVECREATAETAD